MTSDAEPVIAVIPAADLTDGQMRQCRVGDVDVLLCRVAGQVYAVSDQCSHARQSLSAGKLRGHDVICPLHGARFDVRDGACRSAPATKPIRSFPATEVDGGIEVAVTPDPPRPKPKFGPMN